MMMQAPATEVMHLTNDEVYTGVLRFADGRTATLSGYAKGSPFMMNIARSTENSVLEIYGSRKDPRHLGQSPEGLSLSLQKPSQRTHL